MDGTHYVLHRVNPILEDWLKVSSDRPVGAGRNRFTQASAVFHVKHSAGFVSAQSMSVTKLEACVD